MRALGLVILLSLYGGLAVVGLGWGLPTARIDRLLFGDDPVWPGAKIAKLSGVARFGEAGARLGADVDVDPLRAVGREPVDLTATEADVAAIYRRYRLYTHQPDEMITMMALASMRPRQLDFDPKLYQYGGLFIYPVGAAIAAGGLTRLVKVTPDWVYYLDHPDEFGKFYVAARMVVVLWGAAGVLLVYALGARLGGRRTGFLAALLFVLMPVVVCMTHEAKPHLPGAVLMLAAVWWALRYVESGRRRDWAGMCVACGAAFGLVLSSLPIFVLIPLVEGMRGLRTRTIWKRGGGGMAIGLLVYLATNPYVAVNAVCNRAVLLSNLSNSTAMYEVGRLGEGLVRVAELTVEGATLPVVVLGAAGAVSAIRHRRRDALPLMVPAGLIFVQFVLLGAGKPVEYGRFGVFCDTALAIGAACVLTGLRRWVARSSEGLAQRPGAGPCDDLQDNDHGPGTLFAEGPGTVPPALNTHRVQLAPAACTVMFGMLCLSVVLAMGYGGGGYLYNFYKDAGADNTREQFAPIVERWARRDAEDGRPVVCVLADPGPYCLPPMNFARTRLLRYPSMEAYLAAPRGVLVVPADRDVPAESTGAGMGAPPHSSISWANKPMVLVVPNAGAGN